MNPSFQLRRADLTAFYHCLENQLSRLKNDNLKLYGTNVTQAGGKGGKYPFFQAMYAKRVLTGRDQNRVRTTCITHITNFEHFGHAQPLTDSGKMKKLLLLKILINFLLQILYPPSNDVSESNYFVVFHATKLQIKPKRKF